MGFASRCTLALALFVGALATSSQALRADQPVAISGTVVDEGCRPMPNVYIIAQSAGSSVTARTDKRGNFALLSFAGDLVIAVRARGYISREDQWMGLEPGDTARSRLNIQKERRIGSVSGVPSSNCDGGENLIHAQPYDRYVIQ